MVKLDSATKGDPFMTRSLLKSKWFYFVGILLLISGCLFYVLSTDDYTEAKFRTMQDPIANSEGVNLAGLHELRASGGPIVDFPELKVTLKDKKNVFIVDGITAYHGYIGNTPTTFFGYHRPHPDLRYKLRRLLFTGSTDVIESRVKSESEMARDYGFGYKNIKIHSKARSADEVIDDFVDFIDHLAPESWVHFHCRMGKGRTSIMLVMFDIMHNAPQVALNDIVKRQHLLGSENLFDVALRKVTKPAHDGGVYTKSSLENRKTFIEKFYAFIAQRKSGGIQKWSEWNSTTPAS
jgi:hypothetical protein